MISGGGVPAVSVVGQTTIAPLLRTSSKVTQGERSGVASKNRLGRLGAPSEIKRGGPRIAGDDLQRRAGAALEALGERTARSASPAC